MLFSGLAQTVLLSDYSITSDSSRKEERNANKSNARKARNTAEKHPLVFYSINTYSTNTVQQNVPVPELTALLIHRFVYFAACQKNTVCSNINLILSRTETKHSYKNQVQERVSLKEC